jgi:hypothetical protein
MTLPYSQQFPWGKPTLFLEKICTGLIKELNQGYNPISYTLNPTVKELEAIVDQNLNPKLHSIREDAAERWPPKTNRIHHVYDNRTPKRKCFAETPCLSTQRLIIMYKGEVVEEQQYQYVDTSMIKPRVFIDGRIMETEQIDLLARNDGFDSTEDFFKWFSTDFTGKIIHWTKLRY